MSRQSRLPPILLTRPAGAADRLARLILQRFGPVNLISSPLLALSPVAVDLPDAAFPSLIFTSEAGVAAWATTRQPAATRAYCVGDRTTGAAEQAGLAAQSAKGDAADLIRLILQSGDPGPFLHLHGRETRGDVVENLRAAGLMAQGVVAYDQMAQPLTNAAVALLSGPAPVIAPLFSPRTAQLLAEERVRLSLVAPIWGIALSRAVADALPLQAADRMVLSEAPDAPAVIRAMERMLGFGA